MALYPDHDIELTFDVDINVDDIRDVNTLRLLIYNALDGDVQSETLRKSFSEIKKSQVRFKLQYPTIHYPTLQYPSDICLGGVAHNPQNVLYKKH